MPMETILNSRGSIRAMKTFFQKHQRLHIWLLTDLSLLAVFCLVRENRTWMNALAKHVAGPLRQAVGRLCYRTEFSVMEVLAVLRRVDALRRNLSFVGGSFLDGFLSGSIRDYRPTGGTGGFAGSNPILRRQNGGGGR